MSQTVIPFGDIRAVKRWSPALAVDVNKKSYFNRKFIGTGDNSVIQRKTELDCDAGDRISFDLSVQLRHVPTRGDDRLKGNEENLKFFTDEVIVDQMRKSVSAGGRMTRKRSVHDLRVVARDRLSDYWAKYLDELHFIYLSGARGINEDFFEPEGWAGHAGNPIQEPDARHQLYGGAATSKASMADTDKFTATLVEEATVLARMMRAVDPSAANMMPVTMDGENRYVCVMSPFQEHDLRTTSGANGWLEIQKAAAAADGKDNPLFKGSLGMINNVILHSHENAVRFSDYGPASNLPAARALFLGRQAGVCAHGTSQGTRFSWKEEMDDFDNEPIVAAGTIYGVKKTRFNGADFGVIALDTYAQAPAT